MRTLYDKLGVPRHASAADIDRSYRNSLSEHIAGNRNRPMRRKDQLRLQQMRRAYLVLSSPTHRREYDLKLGRLEHARLRRIERVGTAFGLVLLIAGLAIITHTYYRQVHDGKTATQAASAEKIPRPASLDSAYLSSDRHVASHVLKARAD